LDWTWPTSAAAESINERNVNTTLLNGRKKERKKKRTFGTATWNDNPETTFCPVTWNRANTLTTPGLFGLVCGVNVTFSSFFSYAV
jgi:hypothetical protein